MGEQGKEMKNENSTRDYPFFLLLVLLRPQPLSLSTGSERCSDQPMDGGRGRQLHDGSEQTNKQSWTYRSPSSVLCKIRGEKKWLNENKHEVGRISIDQLLRGRRSRAGRARVHSGSESYVGAAIGRARPSEKAFRVWTILCHFDPCCLHAVN